ncbi:MAG: DsbA family protein [Sulfitobacter sp.]
MKPELFYITDAYCIWCYGFSNTIGQLAKEHAETLDIRVVNGGMIPSNMPLGDMFGRFPDPVALHQHVTVTSGQAFGKSYLNEIKNYRTSKRILNSSTPARAMTAFKLLGVKDELGLADAIQSSYYRDGHDLQNIASYQPIAALFKIDFAAFTEKFNGPEAAQGVVRDRQLVEQLGVQGFPALLLRTADNRFAQIARGFMPFDGVKANLDPALATHFPSDATNVDGQICGLDGEGC